MIKYRILEEERADGTVLFVPQAKSFLFWCSFWTGYDGEQRVQFTELDDAKSAIESYKLRDARASVVNERYHEIKE